MQMIDGFNEGWICFEGSEDERAIGNTQLEEVLRGLLKAEINLSPFKSRYPRFIRFYKQKYKPG
jgi:hypothetical protein